MTVLVQQAIQTSAKNVHSPANTSELTVESPAPVEIIRDLASEFLDGQSPKARNKYPALGSGDDIVSKGVVPESQAQELVDMYISF